MACSARLRCEILGYKMSAYASGQHEHGQNFLRDNQVIHQFTKVVAQETAGPIIEIGPGKGALAKQLSKLGRPLTGVEIDPYWVHYLNKQGYPMKVVQDDFLRYRLPAAPHVIVGNIPFHLTTAILRKLFRNPHWTSAVLIVQWEVARRRAGVGSSTMMTAQWAPWYEFRLGDRVAAAAFKPQPCVDGGVLCIHRRPRPLIPVGRQQAFQQLVHRVFTGRGRGIAEICVRRKVFSSRAAALRWAWEQQVNPSAVPSALKVEQWVSLFRAYERQHRLRTI